MMSAADRSTSWIERLDRVMVRLQALAGTASGSAEAKTEPDPTTGERWEEGQVWSHMAEFVPYWLLRCERIGAEGRDRPVPFGRETDDPERVAGIELGRRVPIRDLLAHVRAGAADVRTWLHGLPADAWEAHGLHPRSGVVDLDRVVDEFLVGHLEQHADQLEALEAEAQR
jgi:hypothetical protein